MYTSTKKVRHVVVVNKIGEKRKWVKEEKALGQERKVSITHSTLLAHLSERRSVTGEEETKMKRKQRRGNKK